MNEAQYQNMIECLIELSDRSIQETLWAGKVPNQQSDFIEAVERLFSDTGLGRALESQTTGFENAIESKFQELSAQLRKIESRRNVFEIVNDPAMSRVRELAKEILFLLEKR